MTRGRFCGAVSLAFGSSLLAQSPTDRPPVDKLSISHPAGSQRRTLGNGVTLVLLPFGSTPKTEIRVVVDTRSDRAVDSRLRSMLPTIWRTGTATLTGDALADSLERIGGALTAAASPGGVALALDALSSALSASVTLLADAVQRPRLDTALIQRANARRGRRGAGDGDAVQAFENAVFGAGSADSLMMPSSVDELRRVYAKYVVPSRTTVYVTGQFDAALARTIVSAAFENWHGPTPSVTPPRRADIESPITSGLIIKHVPGARQSSIVVGARVARPIDSAFARFRTVDALLGGSLSSRISRNIREAKGYVYSPASRLVALNSTDAYWAEVVEVPANVTWPTLREILYEIAGVDSNPPTPVETSSSARFVVGSALMQRASRSGWADEVEASRALGKPWADWDAGLRLAQSTTPAQVRSLVDHYLAPTRLTIVVQADTVTLGAQMDAIRRAANATRHR